MVRKLGAFLFVVLFLAAGAAVVVAGAPFSRGHAPDAPRPDRLFATSANLGIVEIDPATGAVLNSFAAPENQGVSDGLAFDGSVLYYLSGSWDPNTLYALDPDTGAVITSYALPASSFRNGLAALDGLVYILEYSVLAQNITIFDPAAGVVVGTLDIDGVNPGAPPIGGGLAGIREPAALLVTTNPTSAPYELLEIDPLTGHITGRFEHGLGAGVLGVGVYHGQIYLGKNTGGTLTVYDRDGGLLGAVTVPDAIGFQSLGGDDGEPPLDVTKAVTPGGAASPGDMLTYTVEFSATAGSRLGVYDPLTTTLFAGLVPPVPPGIEYEDGAITGELDVPVGGAISLTFAVQIPIDADGEITNRACGYVVPGSVERCRWSNPVITPIYQAPGVPVLLSPPDGTVTSTLSIAFSWQPGAGSPPDGYTLDLDGTLVTTTATIWPSFLAPGSHTWAVRAYNAAGYSPWSAPWSVTVRRFTVYLPLVLRARR